MVLHIHEVSPDSTDDVDFGLFCRLGCVDFKFGMKFWIVCELYTFVTHAVFDFY